MSAATEMQTFHARLAKMQAEAMQATETVFCPLVRLSLDLAAGELLDDDVLLLESRGDLIELARGPGREHAATIDELFLNEQPGRLFWSRLRAGFAAYMERLFRTARTTDEQWADLVGAMHESIKEVTSYVGDPEPVIDAATTFGRLLYQMRRQSHGR